jgi:hypothetical protein
MNIKARVEKLEAAVSAQPPFILVVLVPAKDGKPYRVERGLQRIHIGRVTLHRESSETEDGFVQRAKAQAEKLRADGSGMQGVHASRVIADYGESDM